MTKVKFGFILIVLIIFINALSTSKEEAVLVTSVEPIIPTYDLPLNEELQVFTYTTCLSYSTDKILYPLVLAVMWQESNFNPNKISETNDYGLLQINKVNHSWLSKNLGISNFLDPKQNILAGTYMLASYWNKYQDIDQVLMVYNLGESRAKHCWRNGIYNTSYSRGVREKLEWIQRNSVP